MPRMSAPRRSRARRVPRRNRQPVRPVGPRGGTSSYPERIPLYESILQWLSAHWSVWGAPVPLRKRLALLISGLVAGEKATVGDVAQKIHHLEITRAQEPSIVRRLQRLGDDPRLDPKMVLPRIYQSVLPTLLKSALNAHQANEPLGKAQHARFIGVRLVVDATSKGDQVHILSVGLAYQGIVLPLALRSWKQNVPLPDGEYLAQLIEMLSEVNSLLPPALMDHVLLLADRGFGSPRLLDILRGLGWHWVLRVQNQVSVRLANGDTRPIRELAPRPGTIWIGPSPQDGDDPLTAAFKGAGWRPCQVVAVWLDEHDEPWLLLTDLDASLQRLTDYAQRWAIERLFLSWKSHGWELEQVGIADLLRLRSWLTGLVLATLWRLAAAVPVAAYFLGVLPRHSYPDGHQFHLPLSHNVPWPGKFSLFTWGAKTFHDSHPTTSTPTLCWEFPDWDAPRWSQQCIDAYYGAT